GVADAQRAPSIAIAMTKRIDITSHHPNQRTAPGVTPCCRPFQPIVSGRAQTPIGLEQDGIENGDLRADPLRARGPAVGSDLAVEATTMTSDTIVVDHDPRWSALSTGCARVAAAAPETAESLTGMSATFVVNLSTPGALDAIVRLQQHATVWGIVDA